MNTSEDASSFDVARMHHTILQSALACQAAYECWKHATTSDERTTHSRAYHAAAEHLLALLRADLAMLARRWQRSGIASDHESLTLNLFAAVIVALPRLRLDPQRNVRNLLLRVAWRGIYDQYHRDFESPRRASAHTSRPASDDDQRPTAHPLRFIVINDTLPDRADSDSYDAEDRWIYTIDRAVCWQAIVAFWDTALSEKDRTMITLRLQERSFQEIADQFGEQAATIRQRYHRTLNRTRAHLRQLGLMPEGD